MAAARTSIGARRSHIRARLSAALVLLALTAVPLPDRAEAIPAPDAAAVPRFAGKFPLVAGPAYFRPVVVDGMAFPVARSNHLSLLRFSNNWHAVRMRLIDGRWRPVGVHEGIDITAEAGTPVLAMAGGVVERTGYLFYSGLRVWLEGFDGRHYLYAHLSALAPGIWPGARVQPGQMLGLMGNTGYGPPGHRDEFAPHLHLGIEAGDEWVNPYPSLVSLYEATRRRNARDAAALESLAEAGRRDDWRALADRIFTTFS